MPPKKTKKKTKTKKGVPSDKAIKVVVPIPDYLLDFAAHLEHVLALPKEHLSPSDMVEAEGDRLFTALFVDSIKKHMTPTQLTIAEYIMDGKTYKEIGSKFGHSDVWVRQELDKLKKVLEKKGIGS